MKVLMVKTCCECGIGLGSEVVDITPYGFQLKMIKKYGKLDTHGLCEKCEFTAYEEVEATINETLSLSKNEMAEIMGEEE